MSESATNRKPWIIGGVAFTVLLGGGWVIASHFLGQHEEQVAISIPRDASLEDRFEAVEKLREQMRREDLSDEEREKLGERMRQMWESEVQARVNEYFEADPERREDIINRHIDDMEKWRKLMDGRRDEEDRKARDEGKSEEEIEKEREARRERWRERMRSASREERKERSETRNPNETAQRMAYFGAMRKQMEKRGIQPPGPPGGGPGGRGPFGGGPPRG